MGLTFKENSDVRNYQDRGRGEGTREVRRERRRVDPGPIRTKPSTSTACAGQERSRLQLRCRRPWALRTTNSARWASQGPQLGRKNHVLYDIKTSSARRSWTAALAMRILVTGAAGFIGFHTAQKLLERGTRLASTTERLLHVRLKLARLEILQRQPGFRFVKLDLADREGMSSLFAAEKFHRGHQPRRGSRGCATRSRTRSPTSTATWWASANNPRGCRHHGSSTVYASTSSVYGRQHPMPVLRAPERVHPLSFYAPPKKAKSSWPHPTPL